jgi:hypothetical protein
VDHVAGIMTRRGAAAGARTLREPVEEEGG